MHVPAATPVTIPEPDPTLAIARLLLLQLPPPELVRVVVAPTQTEGMPEIGAGEGLTVTGVDALQPVGNV